MLPQEVPEPPAPPPLPPPEPPQPRLPPAEGDLVVAPPPLTALNLGEGANHQIIPAQALLRPPCPALKSGLSSPLAPPGMPAPLPATPPTQPPPPVSLPGYPGVEGLARQIASRLNLVPSLESQQAPLAPAEKKIAEALAKGDTSVVVPAKPTTHPVPPAMMVSPPKSLARS